MDEHQATNRRTVIIVIIVMAAAGGLILVRQLLGPGVHQAKGTITSLDMERREAAVEVIDPANGTSREFRGVVPPECRIRIAGESATLKDLRIGDVVHVLAHARRQPAESDGKRHARFVAERIEVMSRGTGSP